METTTKEHLGWIDLLRVLACFLVVLSHCCDPFVAQFDADRSAFLTGMFTGSTVRCCVPLFVMMTGVLLLPVQTGMSAFYRKRIGRIALPLVFWSLALPALYCVYLNCGGTTSNPQVVMEDHTLRATLTKLYTLVKNYNGQERITSFAKSKQPIYKQLIIKTVHVKRGYLWKIL